MSVNKGKELRTRLIAGTWRRSGEKTKVEYIE